MFVLYSWTDILPLGTFETYDDAYGYAFNILGFTTSHEFYINEEKAS